MNTASQDIDRHLDILRGKLTHPTDYELALFYFLDEFAGDIGFHAEGERDEALHLRGLIRVVAAKMLKRTVSLDEFGAFYLPGHGFFHGLANASGDPVIFFYFERINLGMATLVDPGASEQLVARWHLPENMARNPRHN